MWAGGDISHSNTLSTLQIEGLPKGLVKAFFTSKYLIVSTQLNQLVKSK